MRNLKKHLSVLLVLAMVFTMLAPGFAASSYNYEDEAKALYGLGLYKGVSDKNFVPDLGSPLTREQSAIILLRLFGQEQEAEALTEGQVNESLARFADAGEVSGWARHQVAYAASTGVIKGIQSENGLVFNPKGALKGIDYASLVLQQLGVKDFDYFGALEKLASLNAITVPQMIAFDKEQLIRDDVVGMSYGVLTTQAENGSTVIENLIEKGLVERAYAEELGLVEKTETPVVEPTEEPTTEPTEEPVSNVAKVEFVPAESRVLSRSQSLFEIGQVQITAAEEPVVVTGLKLQRTGISADTVVKSITVWNGNDKVNSIGRFSTGIANIAFTKMVTVPAGQTVKLPIKINVNNTAGVASELRISLLEVKSDTALAGTFPMVGNAFTIANADLGTMTVTKSGDAPVSKLNAGDKYARLAKFDFEIGNESQILKKVIFSQDGTASDTDLANLKLVDEDGETVALGTLDRGELVFDLNKECISGTTTRLTVRGDVVGGAGRTIRFSVDNVNDIQSIGKIYGTTIVASSTVYGSELEIGKGAFTLAKHASSPDASTVAHTVDDQKFAAIEIETIGEPIQVETVTVGINHRNEGPETALREIKLVSNGVVVASQEIKKTTDLENGIELPLSEVLTIEPNSPVVMNILVDLKNAQTSAEYEVGITNISGTGMASGKDVLFPSVEEDEDGNPIGDIEEGTYGSTMRVGDVNVTVEPEADVDGYVFQNQAGVELAEFNINHNLGERVRLSSLTIDVIGMTKKAGSDNYVPMTEEEIQKTFKNIKLLSSNDEVSEKNTPIKGTWKIALKDGVIIDSGKTVKLRLVGDIKTNANQGDQFVFRVSNTTAVTVATGTKVTLNEDSKTISSRMVTVANGVTEEDIDAGYSIENEPKSRNIRAGDSKFVEVARWTFTNDSKEAVKVNKVYLTPNYPVVEGQENDEALKFNFVKYVLKAEGGKDNKVETLKDDFSISSTSKEIEILTNGSEGSKFVIDAYKDGEKGEKDLVLYAKIADGAAIGSKLSVSLGKVVEEGSDPGLAANETVVKKVAYYEVTGKESGFTKTVFGNYKPGKAAIPVSEGYPEGVPAEAPIPAKLINSGKGNEPVESTVSISTVYVDSHSSGDRDIKANGKSGEGQTAVDAVVNTNLASFTIRNDGEKTIGLNKITLDLDGTGIEGITELALYESDSAVKKVAGDVNSENVKATVNGKKAVFQLGEGVNLKLKKGESKVFTIRTTNPLVVGKTLEISLNRAETTVVKANFNSNEVGLDYKNINDDKETISLGIVHAVNP